MSAARVSRRNFLRGNMRAAIFAAVPTEGPLQVHATHQTATTDSGARACIRAARCLANMSQVCTVCVERCGERGAIRLQGLYPMIDAALCTGCGDCASACPAPGGAIVLIARRVGA